MFTIFMIATVAALVYLTLNHHSRLETVEAAMRAVPGELKVIEERAAQAAAAEAKKL